MKLKISVIIPVKNGAATLEKCLNAIKQQTIAEQIEIIILDSISTDKSREIATTFSARIIAIPNGSFNHGLTRNVGVEFARGNLLFFTVQDAYLTENNQLERMAAYFKNSQVQGVVGMQATPHDIDKNPAQWFRRFTEPTVETRYFSPETPFCKLSQKKQFELSNWDNVNAMYRKKALQTIPFIKTSLSEDWVWANTALHKGMKLIRDPSLVVYHYHHMFFGYAFKSVFILSYHFYKFFKQLPKITWSPVNTVKTMYVIIRRSEISYLKKCYWMLYNMLSSFARFLSILIFRAAYSIGKKTFLDKAYHLICHETPQGLQKSRK